MKRVFKLGSIQTIVVFIHLSFSILTIFLFISNLVKIASIIQLFWTLVIGLRILKTIHLNESVHSFVVKRFQIINKEVKNSRILTHTQNG